MAVMLAPLVMAAMLTASDPLDAAPGVRAPTPEEERRIVTLVEAAGRLSVVSPGGARFVNLRRLTEAREELAQAEEIALNTFGPDHAVTLRIKARIGAVMLLTGREEAARVVLADAVAGLSAIYPATDPELADARLRLSEAALRGGDARLATAEHEALYAATTDPTRRVSFATEIAALHLNEGRLDAARPWVDRVRPAVDAATPEDAAWLGRSALTAARLDLASGDPADAEALFMAAAGAEASLERISITLIDAVLGMVLAIQAQGRIDEAVVLLRDAQLLVRERDSALGAGEGEASSLFAEVFRRSVTGFWRMADRIDARREAAARAGARAAP